QLFDVGIAPLHSKVVHETFDAGELPGVNIEALCDRQFASVERFMHDFGVKRGYTDVEELFASCEIDFVDIAAPTAAHVELVRAAARHGVDIICQKPFAGSLA